MINEISVSPAWYDILKKIFYSPETEVFIMTIRDNTNAILHYKNYDYMPVVHFGYWGELLSEWLKQGHITEDEARGYGDGNAVDRSIADKLGFDFCWTAQVGAHGGLLP